MLSDNFRPTYTLTQSQSAIVLWDTALLCQQSHLSMIYTFLLDKSYSFIKVVIIKVVIIEVVIIKVVIIEVVIIKVVIIKVIIIKVFSKICGTVWPFNCQKLIEKISWLVIRNLIHVILIIYCQWTWLLNYVWWFSRNMLYLSCRVHVLS